MGFRFSLEHANWLAHILQPLGAIPPPLAEGDEIDTLRHFLSTFERNFYTSRRGVFGWLPRRDEPYFLRQLDPGRVRGLDRGSALRAIHELREFFRDTPWIALLVPSGRDERTDNLLTNAEYLESLVQIRPDDPGLILQLDIPPRDRVALENVFPAFKVALNEMTRWPGILLWAPGGAAAFFELSLNEEVLRDRANWIFSHLATHIGVPNLSLIKQQYLHEMNVAIRAKPAVQLLHISDLHLGSNIARRRLSRVQTLIETIIREFDDNTTIVPIITGDLMDTPSEENLGDVRAFFGFMNTLGTRQPILLLGNHDVREDGWLNPKLDQAVNVSRAPVVWLDESEIGILCFNSVNGGRLARGWIGEQEFTYVGNEMDRRHECRSFTYIAALHHHPIPVTRPDWYKQAWYESLFGSSFEKTESLEDAEVFLKWINTRKIPVVLHGHKHIPRYEMVAGTAIVGCGSTVGKVETVDVGQTYMSINLITIDRSRDVLACRLRAERIPGAGLESDEHHELAIRGRIGQF